MWESSIPNLPTDGLIELAKDTEHRIGSHVSGGNPIDEYVERQRYLLSLIQDELAKRT
jgi:hypothetical protein